MLIEIPNLNHRTKEDDHLLIKWEISCPSVNLDVRQYHGFWAAAPIGDEVL